MNKLIQDYQEILENIQDYLTIQEQYNGNFLYVSNLSKKLQPENNRERDIKYQTKQQESFIDSISSQRTISNNSNAIGSQERLESSLQRIKNSIAECKKCPLSQTCKHPIIGIGHANAQIMFVALAPSQEEIDKNTIFAGETGKLWEQMLKSVNIAQENIYLCYLTQCCPSPNQEPTPEQIQTCSSWFNAQCATIRPKLIVAMDFLVAQFLVKSIQNANSIEQFRKQIHKYNNSSSLICTYSPYYILQHPSDENKKQAYYDLMQIRAYQKTPN